MTTIHADELNPGDVVVYHGQPHQVTRVDRGGGWAWPVAYDDTGWAIALGHGVIVLRPSPEDPTQLSASETLRASLPTEARGDEPSSR